MPKKVTTQAGVWEALLGPEAVPAAAVVEVDAGAAGGAGGGGSTEGGDASVALGCGCVEKGGSEC